MTIINLSDQLAILEVSGPDAATYLQGQLTNDINLANANQILYAAHLNPKGRMLASFLIFSPQADSYYLITDKAIANKIFPRLKMYVLRSKVSLLVSGQSCYLSDKPIAGAYSVNLTRGYYLNISAESLAAEPAVNHWRQLLVEQGLPMIYPASSEKIIPQQVNYELIGGISFKKGCYTGQEIVARTHYLGKVKRRMVKFDCQVEPQIGQTVVSPKLDNQEVGFIVDFYPTDSGYRGLASIQTDCLEQAYLDTNNQQQLMCTSLITSTDGE